MSREGALNLKEWLMIGITVIISLTGSFSAYVVNDIHKEMQELRVDLNEIQEKNDIRFAAIAKDYVLHREHDKDMETIRSRMERELVLFRRED